MTISRLGITALLFAAVICLGLNACGRDIEIAVIDSETDPSLPTNVAIKTGTIATDSWGYTGLSPIQVNAPAKTEIVIKERTLLEDDSHYVVSGSIDTSIRFSADLTTLTAAAQAAAPAGFVSWLDLSIGSAVSAFPAFSVTVEVGAIPPGETVTIYNYDAVAGRWTSAQPAVASSSGKITFPAGRLSLWGIFRI